jgi:RNA polymerase sigma factor (sigma-70 family)
MTTAFISYARADATDSEADLLRRIGAGDELAWHEVVRRYGKLVSATVRSFRLQEADARDAVQMTWLRLAENADRVQSPGRLGGWLVTTARRECLHILRQAKHGSNLIDGHGHVDEILPLPPTNVHAWEQRHEVLRLLDCLSPLRRQVMALTLDGYTPAEIASKLEIAPETVRSRLIRARRTLAGYLRPTEDVQVTKSVVGQPAGRGVAEDRARPSCSAGTMTAARR